MKKLLLFLIVTLTVVTAKAQYLSIGNLKYYITDDYAYTLECVGLSGAGQSANPTEIDIPGKIEYGGSTYTVTNVGSSAFSGNTTISVLKVCYGVTSIGTSAFSGCTALSYVYLPSSVNTIGNYAFANTSKMAQFNYAAQRVPTVYSNTFSGMRSASLVLSTMEAKSAFNSSSTFTTAFSGISANGRGANDFSSGAGCYVVNGSNTCMLVGLLSNAPTIPVSATNNDNYTFGGLSSPEYYKVTVAAPRLAELSEMQSSLTSFTWLGSEAKKIGISAFQGCTALTTVKVSADTLDNYAFYNCPAITTLQLYETGSENNGVKRIHSMAFAYDHGLTNVHIPSSVVYMAEGSNMPFYMCNNLAKYTVASGNQHYAATGYGNLYDKSFTKLIHMPRNGGGDNFSFFLSGYQMEVLPSTVTEIGDYACYYHNKLETAMIPFGVKTIGKCAFANCDKLTYMLIPSSVTNYKADSFNGLYSLTDLYLNRDNYPSQLANLVNRGNINLHVPYPMVGYYKATTLGQSFKSVDGNAWDITSGFLFFTVTSVEPYSDPNNNVNYTGGQAKLVHGQSVYVNNKYNFYDVEIPRSLNVGGKFYCPTTIEKNYYEVLKQSSSTENNIVDGHTIKEVEDSAFYNCQNLKISNGSLDHLQTIGMAAFYKTTSLTSIDLSDVEMVKEYAFNYSGLSGDIELPKIHFVGLNAFFYCPAITSMTFYGAPTLTTACFGYNADGCLYFVDASQYYRLTHQQYSWYIDDMTTSNDRMRPFVKLNSDSRIFSCYKSVAQPAGASFYTIPSYDASSNQLTTSKWNGAIPASTAMLMKGTKGHVYKFKNLGTSTETPTNILVPVIKDYFVNTVGGYLYNEQTHQFDYDTGNEVSPYSTIEPSYGYLTISTPQNHVNIDLFDGGTIPGDVNGDGKVNVSDVSALINMIMSITPMNQTLADVNGDGKVNVSDVSALINIILGVS